MLRAVKQDRAQGDGSSLWQPVAPGGPNRYDHYQSDPVQRLQGPDARFDSSFESIETDCGEDPQDRRRHAGARTSSRRKTLGLINQPSRRDGWGRLSSRLKASRCATAHGVQRRDDCRTSSGIAGSDSGRMHASRNRPPQHRREQPRIFAALPAAPAACPDGVHHQRQAAQKSLRQRVFRPDRDEAHLAAALAVERQQESRLVRLEHDAVMPAAQDSSAGAGPARGTW